MANIDGPRVAAGSMTDGTGAYGALAQDIYENIPDLVHPAAVGTYARMRRDPKIKGVLSSYSLPLQAAEYGINPKGCRDEVVQYCADAWGLPIIGDNDGPGPARRRGVLWDEHLRVALSVMLPFGYSPFAIAGEVTGDPMRWRLTELSERLPQTISDIKLNDDGSLEGIVQYGSRNLVPASGLLWYVLNKEGAMWQGQSMIREAYAPWLIKHEMWRVMAQSSRRFGMGVPTVKAPQGATDADVQKAGAIAAGYRAGDQSGIGLPDGFLFELTGLTGSVPDTLGFARYLDQQIAESALAGILNLDASPNGSRALGDSMLSLLELSWKATARAITGPATQLNIRMVDWTFGVDEPVPAVLCTNVARLDVMADAIAGLTTAGALSPELGMENAIRTRLSLPTIASRPAAPQETPPAQDPATPPTEPGGELAPGGRTNDPAGVNA
jgi:hypothetical protein